MFKWNYESKEDSSSGYEYYLNELKGYSKSNYISVSNEEQEVIKQNVFNIYRKVNIFPITYYNDKGINLEIQKCIEKDIEWNTDVLDIKYNQGSSLCRFLFPNMQDVICKGIKNNSPYYKFYDDNKLKKAISFCLEHKTIKNPIVPTGLKDGLEMLGGNVASNFSPMKAKALYERYCPPNGVIYDYACGFGGRMLGVLSSKNNYTYIGVEPCIETYTHLNELGLHIERTTKRENSYKLFCMGSEDYVGQTNSVDFAFSSPPYFNLEQYSDEPTQCYNKFPTLEEWFEGYVEPTIKNIYNILKINCYYAVNIADFKYGKDEIKYVDKWISISKELGFEYIEQIHMKLQTRRGNGHADNGLNKKEGIFIFKKTGI